jgi:hypothetical protein
VFGEQDLPVMSLVPLPEAMKMVRAAHRFADGQTGGGEGHVRNHVDGAVRHPVARHAGGYVRLVLVIGADHVDLHAGQPRGGILGGQLRRDHRALARRIGVAGVHVRQHPDGHAVARDFRPSRSANGCQRRQQRQRHDGLHAILPPGALVLPTGR